LLKNRKNRRAMWAPPPETISFGGWKQLRLQTPNGLRQLWTPPPHPRISFFMMKSWLRA